MFEFTTQFHDAHGDYCDELDCAFYKPCYVHEHCETSYNACELDSCLQRVLETQHVSTPITWASKQFVLHIPFDVGQRKALITRMRALFQEMQFVFVFIESNSKKTHLQKLEMQRNVCFTLFRQLLPFDVPTTTQILDCLRTLLGTNVNDWGMLALFCEIEWQEATSLLQITCVLDHCEHEKSKTYLLGQYYRMFYENRDTTLANIKFAIVTFNKQPPTKRRLARLRKHEFNLYWTNLRFGWLQNYF